nr:retrovirus-related Pol polyprotein from transposon TNT 1-94 [Tanacetum cinerariifolium]
MPKFTIKFIDKAALKEFDQKSILYQTMHANKSFNINPANHRLYLALMKALIEDENAMDKGLADTIRDHKRKQDDEDDDDNDDPPARLNQNVVLDDDQPQDTFKPKTAKTPNPEWFTQHPRSPSPDPEWNEQYLKSSDPERTYTTSITKNKAARYEIEGIEDMVPTLWSPTKVGITPTKVVNLKATTSHLVEIQKPKLKVYNRRPRQVETVGLSKKAKIVEPKFANNSEPNHTWGSNATYVPSSSSLVNDMLSRLFSGTVRFVNNQIAKIIGYGDYQLGNIIISRVYSVEGLGHNLFFVRQFYEADLEVAFQKNTCFIQNLESVDLLSRSRDTNLYIISLDDMLRTSLICLLSKVAKTKSWLWHSQLSHLNFVTLNKLAKDGLIRGISKLKFQKDHLWSACALGK